MTLREDILLNEDGFVTAADLSTGHNDNGTLFTSQYYLLLKRRGELTESDINAFTTKMDGIINGGNPLRWKGNCSQNSVDNLIGLCAASKALNTDHAKICHSYGTEDCNKLPPNPDSRTTWVFALANILTLGHLRWNYNTSNPDLFTLESWFGRQLGTIGFVKHCAGRRMNPLEMLALVVGFFLTMHEPARETSNRILMYIMLEQLQEFLVFRLIKKLFDKQVVSLYGNWNAVIFLYFGPNGHAFCKYWE